MRSLGIQLRNNGEPEMRDGVEQSRVVYAVRDTVAQDIVGGLMTGTHDAPMIRIFTDGLADPQTSLNKHPRDFELVALGELVQANGEFELSGYDRVRVVLSGAAWLDATANGPQEVK